MNLKYMPVRVEPKMMADSDSLAKQTGRNRSEIVREALAIGILVIVDKAGTVLAHGATPVAGGGENPSPRSSSSA